MVSLPTSFQSLRRRLAEDPRLGRMIRGGVSGLVSRVVAIVVSAISLPLTVRYLGRLEYGVWVTISSTVVMLSVLDLGIANTLTNLISQAYATGDEEEAKAAFSTAFWLTAAVTLVLAILSGAVWARLDWGPLLHLADPKLISHARTCVAISILFFLLLMPLNLANRVLGGYQQVHIGNYFNIINSLLGLVAILITMLLHGDIVQLMIAYCSAMLCGSVALNLWLLFWSKPFIKPHPRMISRTMARSLLRQGSMFFLLQLTGVVVFNSDNLVITHYLGASEVTPYSIAWRLTSYASLLQSLIIPSFWPAFTEAYQKREMAWLRRTYHETNRKTLLAVASAALCVGVVGRPFIRWWAGPASVPDPLILWTMAAWAVIVAITTNQALLLTATGRLRLEATVAVLAAIANLGLSVVLVQRIGAEGVILATILSFLIIMLGPQQAEVRRILRGDFLAPMPPVTGIALGEKA